MSEKIIVEKFSVDEKLPEYDHECIVWFKDGGIYVGEYKGYWDTIIGRTVTHWAMMPLITT